MILVYLSRVKLRLSRTFNLLGVLFLSIIYKVQTIILFGLESNLYINYTWREARNVPFKQLPFVYSLNYKLYMCYSLNWENETAT
jgi:hypothetical protein